MQTVTLGATGLEVTPLAYGTWQFGGDWGPVDDQAAIAAISHARSLGINFFDTAQAYGFGRAERLLAAALADDLRSARESVVIATKGGLRMDGTGLVRDASPGMAAQGRRSQPGRARHRLHRPVPGALARPGHTHRRNALPRWPTWSARA